MSTLLPPTPDSMQRILIQGGISPMSAMTASPAFDGLLGETRSLLQSPDFSMVLESCLDRATDILFKSIKDTIFVRGGSSVDENGAPLQLRLASLLPGMARWSHLAFNGLPNELVDVRTLQNSLHPRTDALPHRSNWQTSTKSRLSLRLSIPGSSVNSRDKRPHPILSFHILISAISRLPALSRSSSIARSILSHCLFLAQRRRLRKDKNGNVLSSNVLLILAW